MLSLLLALFQKFGYKAGGAILVLAGIGELASGTKYEHVAHALVWIAAGVTALAFGQKFKSTTDMMVKSEAEKRIADPAMPTSSSVPAIQKEIEKQLATPPPVPASATSVAAALSKTGPLPVVK